MPEDLDRLLSAMFIGIISLPFALIAAAWLALKIIRLLVGHFGRCDRAQERQRGFEVLVTSHTEDDAR